MGEAERGAGARSFCWIFAIMAIGATVVIVAGGIDLSVAGIYVLGKGDELKITRLQGVEAAEAMFANTYRGAYVPAAGNVEKHWQSCVRLASHTPIFQLVRAWDLDRLLGDLPTLVAHARSQSAETGSKLR